MAIDNCAIDIFMKNTRTDVVTGGTHSAKTKAIIEVMRNYELVGYVKSVSYTKGTYKLTKYEFEAKGYSSSSVLERDLTMLRRIGYQDGSYFEYRLV